MRILILTVGSRGDIQPYVALGKGLADAGHEVMVCTSRRFEPFVTEHALAYGDMNNDLLDLLESDQGREVVERLTNPVQALRTVIEMAGQIGPIQRRMFRDGWETARCFRPDALLYHPKMYCAPQFAERLGVPVIMALLMPMHVPTGELPCSGFPPAPLGRSYNRMTYHLVHALTHLFAARHIRAWRREQDLPAQGAGIVRNASGDPIPAVHGYSRHVAPTPHDWPASATASGYWVLPTPAGWQPPPDLRAFLDAGEPPVYIGFGSMAARNPGPVTRAVLKGTRLAGVRCVLATGWGGLGAPERSEDVLQIDAAPHEWLFPRVSAVVHHGGAGTTAAGLRAGRPSIVCPFFGDQPYWGRRVHELGAGTAPVPQKKLTPARLADALREALGNPEIRGRAGALGRLLREEDGVRTGVETIERLLGPARRR